MHNYTRGGNTAPKNLFINKIGDAKMKDGYFVIMLSNWTCEIGREFYEDIKDAQAVASKWGSTMEVGDVIKIEAGESEG